VVVNKSLVGLTLTEADKTDLEAGSKSKQLVMRAQLLNFLGVTTEFSLQPQWTTQLLFSIYASYLNP
jgi:hypothetical protein